MDPRFLIKLIGIMQIQEGYAAVSLVAQSSQFFPSQVWTEIQEAQEDLRKLIENWKWDEVGLRMSCTEAPKAIIRRLVEEGMYCPLVPRCNLRNYRQLEEAGLIGEGHKIDDLFLENGDPIVPLAGDACCRTKKIHLNFLEQLCIV